MSSYDIFPFSAIRKSFQSLKEYDTIPETLSLRLLEVRVTKKGFRVKHLWVPLEVAMKERTQGDWIMKQFPGELKAGCEQIVLFGAEHRVSDTSFR